MVIFYRKLDENVLEVVFMHLNQIMQKKNIIKQYKNWYAW
jgi:hypothetical protein